MTKIIKKGACQLKNPSFLPFSETYWIACFAAGAPTLAVRVGRARARLLLLFTTCNAQTWGHRRDLWAVLLLAAKLKSCAKKVLRERNRGRRTKKLRRGWISLLSRARPPRRRHKKQPSKFLGIPKCADRNSFFYHLRTISFEKKAIWVICWGASELKTLEAAPNFALVDFRLIKAATINRLFAATVCFSNSSSAEKERARTFQNYSKRCEFLFSFFSELSENWNCIWRCTLLFLRINRYLLINAIFLFPFEAFLQIGIFVPK